MQSIWRWIDWHRQAINFIYTTRFECKKAATFFIGRSCLCKSIEMHERAEKKDVANGFYFIELWMKMLLLNDKSYRVFDFVVCAFFAVVAITFCGTAVFLCTHLYMESGSCHVHTTNALTRPLLLSDYVATFQQNFT